MSSQEDFKAWWQKVLEINRSMKLDWKQIPFVGVQTIRLMRELCRNSESDVVLRVRPHNCQTGEWWSVSWIEKVADREKEMYGGGSTVDLCLWRTLNAHMAKERERELLADDKYRKPGFEDGAGI